MSSFSLLVVDDQPANFDVIEALWTRPEADLSPIILMSSTMPMEARVLSMALHSPGLI